MPNLRPFLIFMFAFLIAAPSWALSIDQVRFGVHSNKTRLVLDLSHSSDFRVFVLPEPYRMIIDLPDFAWQAGAIAAPPGSHVKAVRHGSLQPGISRIVFDMQQPVGVRSAFVLPGGSGKPDRLVIDFSSIPPSSFRAEMNNVHGTLTAGNPAAVTYDDSAFRTATSAPLTSSSGGAPPIPPRKVKKPLVVIDPGHGGVDPGAIGANKKFEKHIVLALAKELKKKLEETGEYRVLMTRDDDRFIKLGDRVKFARQYEADLFVSIHADSLERPNVRGASVYTLSEKASDAQTEKLAAQENRADLIAGVDLSVEDEEVANILVDLAMRDTMNQSKFFAGKLVDTFRAGSLNVLDSPHRHAGFAVLKAPDIPSVLIEAGFMSNRAEADMLASDAYKTKFARTLKKGIDSYFEQVRKNQRM